MHYFPYKRLEQIFEALYTTDYLTNRMLANEYKVSERTIRNDIKELNDLLDDYSSSIKNIRTKGYLLENKKNVLAIFDTVQTSPATQGDWLNSSADRIKFLLSLLIFSEDYLSVDDLCNQIFVGRTTLLSYIRQLKPLLHSYNLTIKTKTNIGYKIIGDESNIRQCIAEQLVEKNFDDYISQFSQSERKLFRNINLEEISKKLLYFFPAEIYKISDYNRKNFVIHLAIAIMRRKEDHSISSMPSITLFDPTIQQTMSNLISWAEDKYEIVFSNEDKRWLFSHFVTELQHQANSIEQKEHINHLVEVLLSEMKNMFGEDLTQDSVLIQDLYIHFSTYLPLQELLKLRKNPLLQAIKKNYSYAFELTFLIISNTTVLKALDFTEDDIAYIALHIAAALERNDSSLNSRKKVLIICGQGVSTSRLIEAVIKKRFSNEIKIVDIVSFAKFKSYNLNEIDFIISTIPVPKLVIPVIQIDFLNMNQSLEQVELVLKNYTKPQILENLFDPSLFFHNVDISERDPLIHYLSQVLHEKDIVSTTFDSLVLERESLAPTNLTSLVAMPHAIDNKTEKTKIMICTSNEPIKWRKSETVKLVFLLIISEKDKDQLQIFFEFLSELVDNHTLQNKLSESTSFNDFISILSSVSQ